MEPEDKMQNKPGAKQRGGGGEGEKAEGEEAEQGRRRREATHLFIMMPVVASVSCVGSRLYFMF